MSSVLYNVAMAMTFGDWLKDQMAERDVDQATVARILRHTSPAVTLAAYAKTSPEQMRSAGEVIGRVLEG